MYLAIDIGGTKTLLAVFDEHGKVVFEHKTPTDKDYEKFIANIKATLDNELRDYEFDYCCCAVPGLLDHSSGVARRFGNLDWRDVPIKDDLQKLFSHTKVLVEHDASLGGLSEALLLQGGYKKVLYLTVSTGIGDGIIINGKIDSNLSNSEAGQMILEHGGKLQKWEDFASGKALHTRNGKLASEIDDPKVWQGFAHDLMLGLEQLLAVIQPDVVIIGGGVGTHFEKFGGYLKSELEGLHNDMVKVPPIIKAQRPEEAVIYGCYDLIKQQV